MIVRSGYVIITSSINKMGDTILSSVGKRIFNDLSTKILSQKVTSLLTIVLCSNHRWTNTFEREKFFLIRWWYVVYFTFVSPINMFWNGILNTVFITIFGQIESNRSNLDLDIDIRTTYRSRYFSFGQYLINR